MKVTFKKAISSYSGADRANDIVFSAYNGGAVCIARDYTKPKEMPQHLSFKANSDTIRNIWNQASAGYKANLQLYAYKYKSLLRRTQLAPSSYALFSKILYAYSKSEGIEVSTMDINSIRTSVIKSIKSTVENGYLPKVSGYATLETTV